MNSKGYKPFLAAIDTGNGFMLILRPSMASRFCGGLLLLIAGALWLTYFHGMEASE